MYKHTAIVRCDVYLLSVCTLFYLVILDIFTLFLFYFQFFPVVIKKGFELFFQIYSIHSYWYTFKYYKT